MTPDEFGLRLAKDCAVPPGAHVLVAVSGGADSTALLCFFEQVREKYPLSCAHVEHGIRGEASLGDMAFVRALCERKNIPLYTAQVDAPHYARAHGCGLEEAARTLRYAFLQETAERIGADVIALAHHTGDQAETVLLHAVRGSDVRGLGAMRMRRGRLIRPLLDCTAQQLQEYLVSVGQPWREDASNADIAYARNRIRANVMPELERVSAGAGAALCRLAAAAQRDEDYFERQIDALELAPVPLVNGLAIVRAQLEGLHPALAGRALVRLMHQAGIKAQNARTIEEILTALSHREAQATVNLTGGAHACLGRRYLALTRADAGIGDTPLCVPGGTDTPFGRFIVRAAQPGETGDGKRTQAIPEHLLRGACVTSRREGDAMIPLGRSSPVSLKKLMIDAGIERAMRPSMPVLRGREGIVWVVGLRPGEACRENTQRMIVEFHGAWPGEDGGRI